jgi:tetratricopeptide (TPR) repeat protein/predicted O-methyltransferase YrrM
MSLSPQTFLEAILETETQGLLRITNQEILTGFSGEKVMGILQRFSTLFSQVENTCYLEVGVFQGLTLLSVASACPSISCYGIDNFAQFDQDKKNYSIIIKRKKELGVKNARLINQDYENALSHLAKYIGDQKVGVYFVDGPHDYRSQLMCLELILPYLHEKALIIIDDCNYLHIRQANYDFLVTHPEYKLLFETYTRCHPNHMTPEENQEVRKGWWNGINVLVRDINNELDPLFPMTERDRTVFVNEHSVHAHFLADLVPATLNTIYDLYNSQKQGKSVNVNALNSLFLKMDQKSEDFNKQGYIPKKQMNTYSEILPTRYNSNLRSDVNYQLACESLKLANKQKRTGKMVEAIAGYRKAIVSHPNSAISYYNLGDILTQMGYFEEAIESYKKAIQLKPISASYHYKLAEVLLKTKNQESAISYFKKAIELNPKFYGSYLQLGKIIKQQENEREVYLYYQKAIELNPKCAEAYAGLGDILYSQGNWQQSLSYYQNAIQIHPNLFTAQLQLGKTLAQLGRLEEAIATYHHTLELHPDFVDIYLPFLEVLIQKSQLDTQESANLQYPKKAESYSDQGTESLNQKNYTQALTYFYQALTLNPSLVSAYLGLGQTLKWQKLTTTAMVSFQQAIELNPNRGDSYHWLGECCVELNEIEAAVNAYQQAISINPKAAHVYRGLASAYQKQGNWDKAMNFYQKSLELNPKYVLAYNQLADAFVEREEWESAVEVYQQSLKLNPQQPGIQSKLDRVLSNLKDFS